MENQRRSINAHIFYVLSTSTRHLLIALLPWASLYAIGAQAAELKIDGIFDEPAWTQAQTQGDLVLVEPFTKAPAQLKTTVRLLAQPAGLALAFVCTTHAMPARCA